MNGTIQTRRGLAVIVAIAIAAAGLISQPAQAGGAASRIGDREDAVVAAIAASQATYGEAQPPGFNIVIGRDDVAADSLGGAALARPGVMLLHPGGPGPADQLVVDEVNRLTDGACVDGGSADYTVHILGGVNALTFDLDIAFGDCVTRYAGSNRNDTSVLIARAVTGDAPAAGDTIDRVFIANDDNPADSASVSSLSVAIQAPVLVTPRDRLADPVQQFLVNNTVGQVTVLGGTAAIDDGVFGIIQAEVGPDNVDRLFGGDRSATAEAIANEIVRIIDAPAASVFLVEGYAADFWTYALPAGPIAAGIPILYTNANTNVFPPGTASYLQAYPPSFATAFGPASRVPDALLNQAVGGGNAPVPPPLETLPDDSVHFASQDRPESILSCTVTGLEEGFETYRMNLIAESYLDVITDGGGFVTEVAFGQFVKDEEATSQATDVSGNFDEVALRGTAVFGQDDAVSFSLLNETIREVCTTE